MQLGTLVCVVIKHARRFRNCSTTELKQQSRKRHTHFVEIFSASLGRCSGNLRELPVLLS